MGDPIFIEHFIENGGLTIWSWLLLIWFVIK